MARGPLPEALRRVEARQGRVSSPFKPMAHPDSAHARAHANARTNTRARRNAHTKGIARADERAHARARTHSHAHALVRARARTRARNPARAVAETDGGWRESVGGEVGRWRERERE